MLALYHSKIDLSIPVSLYSLVTYVSHSLLPSTGGIFLFLHLPLYLLVPKLPIKIVLSHFCHPDLHQSLYSSVPIIFSNNRVRMEISFLSFCLCLIFFQYCYTKFLLFDICLPNASPLCLTKCALAQSKHFIS